MRQFNEEEKKAETIAKEKFPSVLEHTHYNLYFSVDDYGSGWFMWQGMDIHY